MWRLSRHTCMGRSDVQVMGGDIDAKFGHIHFRSRITKGTIQAQCFSCIRCAKYLAIVCCHAVAASAWKASVAWTASIFWVSFWWYLPLFKQEQKEDAPRNSRSAPRLRLQLERQGEENRRAIQNSSEPDPKRASLWLLVSLHFATSAMLVMQDESSSPSSLPALAKRDESRPLVWQQETPNYPPEPPLPPPTDNAKPKKKPNKQVYVCTEVHCGKQFPRSFALRRHMRIHTGTKPYACDSEGCTQRFNTSGNLSRHKRIHSGERPYPCIFESCGKRFNTSTKLKRHMRIHFPEGQNLFRCLNQAGCNWSCDNYKEFAQHQKLHHNIIVGAQQDSYARQQELKDQQHHDHATVAVAESATKDNDYFSTADTTREYSENLSYGNHHVSAVPTGSFLYPNTFDKPKNSVLAPPRNKLMGHTYFGSESLPTMLPKEQSKKSDLDHLYGSDQRRMKPTNAFPSVQYSSTGGSFSISSDSAFNRPNFTTNSSHFAPLRPEDGRSDHSYDQEQQHQHQMLPPPGNHVLRPPPQSNEDSKFGGFAVPPPMNPAAPEFTGEELNVVLQLMNENY